MKIVLSGIETNNKGAELMLYAILQEIDRKFPEAEVFVPVFAIKQGLKYIKTSVNLKEKPYASLKRTAAKLHISGILRRLHLPYLFLKDTGIIKDANYFIDASGFAFSDQWNPNDECVKIWEYVLKGYHKQSTKIVFLPQAFGPVEKPNTKRLIALLNQYADIIMPREKVSLHYLRQCNVDESKLHLFTDFTSLVNGEFPPQYGYLKNAVCIIPNMRMIDKGVIGMKNYLNILTKIVAMSQSMGHKVFLLNHEGAGDEQLAFRCKEKINGNIDVVTGLNALEVKGLIASSYLCISSRFHGVASALNSCVPCLATSWSHKYAELFKDYGMNDCVLDLNDTEEYTSKILSFLENEHNYMIRKLLKTKKSEITEETKEMWKQVWS